MQNFLASSASYRQENMLIFVYDVIKKHKSKLFMKRNILFLLNINPNDTLEGISLFLKRHNIVILGFSLEPFIDTTNFFNLFPNALFIDSTLRKFDEKMISSLVNSFSKISPNISLSITIKKDTLKKISNTNLENDFLFIEDKNE